MQSYDSAVSPILTLLLNLLLVAPVPCASAGTVCAYTQHLATRSQQSLIEDEDSRDNREHCAGGEDACFTLWREVSRVETATQSEDSAVIVIVAQGCWDPETTAYVCHATCTSSQNISVGATSDNSSNSNQNNSISSLHFCCCRGRECNRNVQHVVNGRLVLYDSGDGHESKHHYPIAASEAASASGDRVFLPVILCILLICMAVMLVYVAGVLYRTRELHSKDSTPADECRHLKCRDVWVNASTRTRCEPTATSSSPEPAVVIPVEALKVDQLVARGRFASVYRGFIDVAEVWNGEEVAVKVYKVTHWQIFRNEKEVYRLLSLAGRHPALPAWYGDVVRPDDGPAVEPQLVMSFAAGGSLDSYLKENSIDWSSFCRISLSIASGVAFLHANILTASGHVKPCIIHRDLSSKNILIKTDMSCMICDFGNAFILSERCSYRDHGVYELLSSSSSDSLRYLAPEVLAGTVNVRNRESSLKQVDVYALSLILWEVASRCSDLYQGLPVPDYMKPYERELGSAPTYEQMQIAVTKHKSRPLLADVWKESNPAIKSLRETITDSWDQDADARLTALCVEERLSELPLLWERYRQEQRLLLLQMTSHLPGSPLSGSSLAIISPHAALLNLRNNNLSAHLNDISAKDGQAGGESSAVLNQNISLRNPLSPGEKNTNAALSYQTTGSAISFPIQPFLGRNPCLQRNLKPVCEDVDDSPALLERTLKFNLSRASNADSSWTDGRHPAPEVSYRINTDRSLFQSPAAVVRRPSSRPRPIPQSIHNECLLPKQQNQPTDIRFETPSAPPHPDRRADQLVSQSLPLRVLGWAVSLRHAMSMRGSRVDASQNDEAEPLSTTNHTKYRTKSSASSASFPAQAGPANHPADEAFVVIAGDEVENAPLIRDKETTPKGS